MRVYGKTVTGLGQVYLRNQETQQTEIYFFAYLNDELVKSLLKISH